MPRKNWTLDQLIAHFLKLREKHGTGTARVLLYRWSGHLADQFGVEFVPAGDYGDGPEPAEVMVTIDGDSVPAAEVRKLLPGV